MNSDEERKVLDLTNEAGILKKEKMLLKAQLKEARSKIQYLGNVLSVTEYKMRKDVSEQQEKINTLESQVAHLKREAEVPMDLGDGFPRT